MGYHFEPVDGDGVEGVGACAHGLDGDGDQLAIVVDVPNAADGEEAAGCGARGGWASEG